MIATNILKSSHSSPWIAEKYPIDTDLLVYNSNNYGV